MPTDLLGEIMFYKITISEIRSLILEKYPNATSRENLEIGGEIENLLFMTDTIEALDTGSLRNETVCRALDWLDSKRM